MSVVLCQPTLFYLGFYLKYEYLRTSSVFAYVLTLFLEEWESQIQAPGWILLVYK